MPSLSWLLAGCRSERVSGQAGSAAEQPVAGTAYEAPPIVYEAPPQGPPQYDTRGSAVTAGLEPYHHDSTVGDKDTAGLSDRDNSGDDGARAGPSQEGPSSPSAQQSNEAAGSTAPPKSWYADLWQQHTV